MRRSTYAVQYVLMGVTLLLFLGCASTPQEEKYYYTLRYDSHGEKSELVQTEPVDISVWVRPASISRTYDRKQIVLRHFGPRISYLENHLYANDLEDKVPELILRRLNAYKLFETARLDFPYSRPDYELIPTITALEFLRGEGKAEAVLHVRFELRQFSGANLVTTEIERNIPVYDRSIDSFVQVVNESLLEYTDFFVQDVLAQFDLAEPRSAEGKTELEYIDEDTKEQYGQLLLPDVFENRDLPFYSIIGEDNEEQMGEFGTPVELPVGRYSIRYGTGGENTKMRRTVTIREGYRTIVEPDYGGLTVEIITPNGRPVELPYEIFHAESGNSYGTGYSVESVADWNTQVWVLPAGRYKVILNNLPFNTNRDFSSVYVEKAKGNILTITVEEVEAGDYYRVVGGGVVKEPLYSDEEDRWVLSSSIAGNVTGTVNNREFFDDYSTGYTVNGLLRNRLRYEYEPVNFTHHNLLEIGLTRSGSGNFEITRDTLEVDSTLVLDLLLNLGFYLNADVQSHLLNSYYYHSDPSFEYIKKDTAGKKLASGSFEDEKVKTAVPLLPAEFREGTGLHVTLVKKPQVESNARLGFGLRQDIYGDSYSVKDTSSDTVVLQQEENEYTTGLESSLYLSAQILRNIMYSTRFEAYAPFTDLEEYSLEWSHELQFSFARNISIDYRASLYNTTTPEGDGYIGSDHGVYLRFSTIYRMSF
ncbi:MAG: membrane integrity-associated transporter subunit PqiC [Spirochaetaceae bacterium]